MKLRIHMMGMLKDMEPENSEFLGLEGMTVDELLHTLEVIDKTGAITVNDKIVIDRQQILKENDCVRILGVVGGG